jgi:hypothetical protein
MNETTDLLAIESLALHAEARGDVSDELGVRAQAALVRALVDELRRHPSSDAALASLLEQLEDEVSRLVSRLHLRESEPPASKTQPLV